MAVRISPSATRGIKFRTNLGFTAIYDNDSGDITVYGPYSRTANDRLMKGYPWHQFNSEDVAEWDSGMPSDISDADIRELLREAEHETRPSGWGC